MVKREGEGEFLLIYKTVIGSLLTFCQGLSLCICSQYLSFLHLSWTYKCRDTLQFIWENTIYFHLNINTWEIWAKNDDILVVFFSFFFFFYIQKTPPKKHKYKSLDLKWDVSMMYYLKFYSKVEQVFAQTQKYFKTPFYWNILKLNRHYVSKSKI